MKKRIRNQLQQVLQHLYINPLEKCNLKCQICYTRKTSPILTNHEILDFVNRYSVNQALQSVTFCGGEVFALADFPDLANQLTARNLLIQIITNGTLDQLDRLEHPNLINLIVSLDGLSEYHDLNRGEGNFAKSLLLMKKAHRLGFHLEVFSIVTQQNLSSIDQFETYLAGELGFLPQVTYHPRKPPMYLSHHPQSNITGQIESFDFLTKAQILHLMKIKTVFPPPSLGCYQIAVASDGQVYGCCEGTIPLGKITDQPSDLIKQLSKRLAQWSENDTWEKCLGCSQPDFVCGVKEYLKEYYA